MQTTLGATLITAADVLRATRCRPSRSLKAVRRDPTVGQSHRLFVAAYANRGNAYGNKGDYDRWSPKRLARDDGRLNTVRWCAVFKPRP
jgi:hypothetical protein